MTNASTFQGDHAELIWKYTSFVPDLDNTRLSKMNLSPFLIPDINVFSLNHMNVSEEFIHYVFNHFYVFFSNYFLSLVCFLISRT